MNRGLSDPLCLHFGGLQDGKQCGHDALLSVTQERRHIPRKIMRKLLLDQEGSEAFPRGPAHFFFTRLFAATLSEQ